jgi:hypothetical protein
MWFVDAAPFDDQAATKMENVFLSHNSKTLGGLDLLNLRFS